jgi:hypothetical protein
MSLKTLVELASNKAARPLLHVRKHSPVILFSAGVVGVVTTVVLASRATLRLDEILDQAEELTEKAEAALEMHSSEYSEADFRRDILLIRLKAVGRVAKIYAPAVIVGTLSIAALTGSHVTLTRRNVALTAAYAGLDRAFRQYRDRIVAELGEDKERELRYDLVDVEIEQKTPDGTVTRIGKQRGPKGYSQYAMLFDEGNKNWSPEHMYNSYFIQNQQAYANHKLKAKGHVFLNEVYDMLGLPRTRAGCIVGWVDGSKHGDGYIDFGVFSGDELTAFDFVTGENQAIWLDFNVDGPIWDNF